MLKTFSPKQSPRRSRGRPGQQTDRRRRIIQTIIAALRRIPRAVKQPGKYDVDRDAAKGRILTRFFVAYFTQQHIDKLPVQRAAHVI